MFTPLKYSIHQIPFILQRHACEETQTRKKNIGLLLFCNSLVLFIVVLTFHWLSVKSYFYVISCDGQTSYHLYVISMRRGKDKPKAIYWLNFLKVGVKVIYNVFLKVYIGLDKQKYFSVKLLNVFLLITVSICFEYPNLCFGQEMKKIIFW